MHGQLPLRTLLTLLAAAVAASACDRKPEAPAARPAASPPVAAGPAPSRVETETYAVALSAAAGGGTITLTARPPLHINPDYPAAFKPDPGPVAFAGERVPLGQEQKMPCAGKAEDTCESISTVAYRGGAAGAQVSGTVQFSVCEPEKCLIEKVKVASAIR